jgi:fumarylacetoacetase
MSIGGKKHFDLKGGSKRTYLEDGDSVRITGFAGTEGNGVGFGECISMVVPAPVLNSEQDGSL